MIATNQPFVNFSYCSQLQFREIVDQIPAVIGSHSAVEFYQIHVVGYSFGVQFQNGPFHVREIFAFFSVSKSALKVRTPTKTPPHLSRISPQIALSFTIDTFNMLASMSISPWMICLGSDSFAASLSR